MARSRAPTVGRVSKAAHTAPPPHTAPSSRYTGTSQWITGERARAHSQVLRASSQAIMVGSGTAVADKPKLTVRLADGALPDGWLPPSNPLLRVVLDASGRVRDGPLLDTSAAPTLVFTTAAAAGEARARVSMRAVGQAEQQRLHRRAPQLRRVERPLAGRAHRVERQHLGVAREQRAHEAARHLGQRRRKRRRARRRAQRAVGARRFVQRAKAPAA